MFMCLCMYKKERERLLQWCRHCTQWFSYVKLVCGSGKGGRRFKDCNNKNIGYASHWSSTIVKYQYKV